MRRPADSPPSFRVLVTMLLAAVGGIVGGQTVTWDNTAGDNQWSTGANWDGDVEPGAANDVVFPAGLAAALTLGAGENAKSLVFGGAYTLGGGGLTVAAAGTIEVAAGVAATINTPLTLSGGTGKTGGGTLVLGGSNTVTGGITVAAGTLRVKHASALGGTANTTTVETAATLEIDGISLARALALGHGATLAGNGTAASNGTTTLDPAATAITFATAAVGDVLTIGDGSNDLTGGSAATVIGLAGPGVVRLGAASSFDGSWQVASGRLELGNATALGGTNTSSVSLAGGTLAARVSNATSFTGSPGNNLWVTADSTLLSDRPSAGGGLTHTFGNLTLGSQLLTVAPGGNVTSGTATIALGTVSLGGDPVFAVQSNGPANGKLSVGALAGGGLPRSVTKSGPGDFAASGGTTDLPPGSQFTATGGGTLEWLFPALGSDPLVTVTAAQNPFGQAAVSVTGGTVRLLANGSGNSTAQTYALATALTLGGTIIVDPDRQSGSSSNKTYQLSGLSLAAGADLTIAGDNTHGVALTGVLMLGGDATLRGSALSGKDGLLTVGGGISGGAGDELVIAGGTSPLVLTINGASTYGGGTTISGGTVTLNAAAALGTGPLALSGGTVVVNADGALQGGVSLSGGTLRVNDLDALGGVPLTLGGGTLDLRANASSAYTTGAIALSGAATINVANNGSGTSQTITIPTLAVTGATVLTLTSSNSFVPNLAGVALAGDLTLSHSITAQLQGVTEDATARRLLKAGTGTLKLQGPASHSGGTEVLAGVLLVEHPAALGGGALTLGDTAGSAAATAQFAAGLTISNNIIARAGGTGTLTLDAPGGGVTWTGAVDMQRAMTVDNGSVTTAAALDGLLSGPGDLTKVGGSTVVALGNASNSFGSGGPGSVTVSGGTLAVAADGALGKPANGVTLAGSNSYLRATGTFSSGRLMTAAGTGSRIEVTAGNTLTLTGGLAGTVTLGKDGGGTLALAAGADSSARGTAGTTLFGGNLRLSGPQSLSAGGPITLGTASTVLELCADPDTGFAHPVTVSQSVGIHVDRATGGVGSGGRHSLGALIQSAGTLTVSGANGYGLSLPGYDLTASSAGTLLNNAAAALEIGAVTSSVGTATRTFTVGGSGDIRVAGAIGKASTGVINVVKTGEGTLRFGTAAAGFGDSTTVRDGTLDLNGLVYQVNSLTLGGAASVAGPRLVTGAAGAVQLAGNLTHAASLNAAPSLVIGTLELSDAAHTFTIGDYTLNPVDLTIDGAITGGAGATVSKGGAGTLRLGGPGNPLGGLFTVNQGVVELAASGSAIGAGGLTVTGTGTVRLLAGGQLDDAAPVMLDSADNVVLDLGGFTEATGAATVAQSADADASVVRTGAAGTWMLLGDLTLANNTNSPSAGARNVLVTGSGSETVATGDGTLDLGGALRTVHVSTTTTGQYESRANATIETRVVNGGIIKTGARTLHLTNPANELPLGLRIAGGAVDMGAAGTFGAGLTLAGGGATLVLSQTGGTLAGSLAVTAGGGTISYTAGTTGNLTLPGAVTLGGELTLEVLTGGTADNGSAVLNLSGLIDDGGAGHGLVKTGDGTLKLAAGNTFGGSTTVRRGVVSIGDASALGDGSAPLVMDGGCLHASAPVTLAGEVAVAGGGSFRVDAPNGLELGGNLDWGSGGAVYFYGSGRSMLTGASSGAGGDLTIGAPGPFASGWSVTGGFQLGQVLLLGGAVALPAGNLHLLNDAVLELGNGNFTRPLGTGPGEVQLGTSRSAGWAASGADRLVDLGGAGATVTWGQKNPPFLYRDVTGDDVGDLVLGSATATHTVEFRNGLELNNGETFMFRSFIVPDGPAALEARVAGDITLTPPPGHSYTGLDLLVSGALEISGDLSGPVSLIKEEPGTATLSGHNTQVGGLYVYEGTLVLAGPDSSGAVDGLEVSEGARLDAAALAAPLTAGSGGYLYIGGTVTGDVEVGVGGELDGSGEISGDLTALAGAYIYPDYDTVFHVGGDFTLAADVTFSPTIGSIAGLEDLARMRVTGAVVLTGMLDLGIRAPIPPDHPVVFVLLLNDGDDPISGTFDGLPEGGLISLGGGLALRATYQANGDGGAVGNDFGLTVVPDNGGDLAAAIAAPLVVDIGASIDAAVTIENVGAQPVNDGTLHVTLPPNAAFVGSTPAGTVSGGVLTVTLPPVAAGASTDVLMQWTAPGAAAPVVIEAALASAADGNPANDSAGVVVAVLAGGRLVLTEFGRDPLSGDLGLGIDTLLGVRYLLEKSPDLAVWQSLQNFIGTGLPFHVDVPVGTGPREFFRLRVVR